MTRPLPVFAALVLGLAACGGPPPPPPGPLAAPPRPVRPPAPEAPPPAGAIAAATYDANGARDPFVPLEITGGPKSLTVASTRLTGLVWGRTGGLALLEASDGIGYILRPGDTLGDGRLVAIEADSAVFSVVPRPGAPPTRVTLRLKTDY